MSSFSVSLLFRPVYLSVRLYGYIFAGEDRRSRHAADGGRCLPMAAHRIAPTAEQAVDAAIANGSITRDPPFVRRGSVRLVKSDYSTQERVLEEIDKGVRGFYTGKNDVDDAALARTIGEVKNVYRRNVFPAMKVTSGVYPDNIGHITSDGCIRCQRRHAHHVRWQHDQLRRRVWPQADRAAERRQTLSEFLALSSSVREDSVNHETAA